MLGGAAIAAADSAFSGANKYQHSENRVLLHNYSDIDTVATCGAAGPVVAGLAIAATGVSTVTAANDIVEITTGVSPLKEGAVALGGNEDIYNGIRTGLDVATMLTPGGGGKAALIEGGMGLAATGGRQLAAHGDDLLRAGTKHADDAGRAVVRTAEDTGILTNKTFTNQTGRVDNYTSPITGYPAARSDFDSLPLGNVRTYSNGTTVGDLSGNVSVNVREFSKDSGPPTLQFYDHTNQQSVKIRY
jgi:hypothetical protein